MTKPIVLKKAECLPIMRKAFRAGELQALKSSRRGKCLYAGPCVIGAVLTEDQRELCDAPDDGTTASPTISRLIAKRVIKTDDDNWFRQAQTFHDAIIGKFMGRNRTERIAALRRHLGIRAAKTAA